MSALAVSVEGIAVDGIEIKGNLPANDGAPDEEVSNISSIFLQINRAIRKENKGIAPVPPADVNGIADLPL